MRNYMKSPITDEKPMEIWDFFHSNNPGNTFLLFVNSLWGGTIIRSNFAKDGGILMSDLPIQHGWEISWEFEWEHHRTRWGSPAIHV